MGREAGRGARALAAHAKLMIFDELTSAPHADLVGELLDGGVVVECGPRNDVLVNPCEERTKLLFSKALS